MASVAEPVRPPNGLVAEQLREHYAQIPAMAIAPTLGMAYTAWVLWDAAPQPLLLAGMASITTLSALRLLLFWRFRVARWPPTSMVWWARLAVLASLLSGCLWGSAAPLLYPAASHGEYDTYLLVLLSLVPIIPVAALAAYLPAFYVYYLPCMTPFVVMLALQPGRAERLTALLLVIMMAAMLTFARRYAASLTQAIALRLMLADKSAALEASVRQMSRLIAAASHDLRQPVHAMGLFLETAHAWRGSSDEPRMLAYLQAGVRSLRSMLDNMLDLSRLDADAVAPRWTLLPVHDLVHRLADEYAVLALNRGLVLRCRSVEAWARTDPVLLERILRNLLSNALKFTRHGGVVLALRVQAEHVMLQVVDTGIGIAPQDADRVFEPFTRLPAGVAADDGASLGLGLAIVNRLSRLLGHPLRLDSRLGRGSRFTLVLPRLADVVAGSELAGIAGPGPQDMPPCLVMLLDDDDAVATGTATLLRHWGHRVLVCDGTSQALQVLAVSPQAPDLLLVDLGLGAAGSGLLAIQQIRHQSGRHIPAVLVTGNTAAGPVRKAIAAGHLLLHKPVDPQRLRSAMAEARHVSHAPTNDSSAPLGGPLA